MASPPPSATFPSVPLPPLPPGWTEHKASGDQLYYYHAGTGQSTYIRPLPIPGIFSTLPSSAIIPGAAPRKKKERPLVKTPIPNTSWLRVKTTEGNVFYTHKEKKESVWLVPEEIKEHVEQLERQEKEQEERETAEKLQREEEEIRQAEEEERLKEHAEIERVKQEVQRDVSSGKRKSSDSVEKTKPAKRQKAQVETDGIPSDKQGSEEEWRQTIIEEEITDALESRTSETARPVFTVPDRVDLSLDEAKALFKTLLKEKDINPLHPWDKSLPLFISDPRYVLLPSVAARREAFDQYCRDTLRAQRLAKAAAAKEEASATGDKDKDAYYQLLKDEVSSTRTSWTEFRKKWKKDRRFFGWAGEHEREKVFREWLKDLANRKKKQAEQAERDFFRLLQEYKEIGSDSEWKSVKHSISTKDPRYDAVGSASLREELFNVYVKNLKQSNQPLSYTLHDSGGESHFQKIDSPTNEQDRKQRALQEREEKVRRERKGIERQLDQTRGVLGREEGELEFGSLLTDAIREPTLSWEDALPLLSGHPLYVHSNLSVSARKVLFYKHVGYLREKYLKSLHASFAAYTSKLTARWSDLDLNVRKTISRSLPVSKLKLVIDDSSGDEDLDSDTEAAIRRRRGRKDEALEMEFDRWQRQRNADARKSFNDMLNENAFLEFWGKMNKIGGEGVEGGVKAEEEDEEEGEGGGGKADMKKLAKQIDEDEFGRVLKNDARWTAFDQMPEERMKWLRDHMSRLSAPNLSVHVRERR